MNKNKKQIILRRNLCLLVLNKPEKAAKYFEHLALTLRQCKTTSDRFKFLSDTLFLSQRTIERDILKPTT